MPLSRIAVLFALLLPGAIAAAQIQVIEVVGRGNVRFAPTTDSRVITTLSPGDVVDSLGRDPRNPEWFAIRFPEKGHGWMHRKVLAPTTGEKTFRVVVDGARVRADSRVTADMIAELAVDETVRWTGKKVGGWLSVHPPEAIAYMHHSVLRLDGSDGRDGGGSSGRDIPAISSGSPPVDRTQRLWEDARSTYQDYRRRFNDNARKALHLDWPALAERLDRISEEHREIRIRLQARKLRASIQRVVIASQRIRASGLDSETAVPAETARGPEPRPEVRRDAVASAREEEPATGIVATPEPRDPPPVVREEPAPTPMRIDGAELAAVQEPDGYVRGWLEQRDDVAGVGANHVLIDEQGTVLAYVKVADGQAIDLAEYFWRRVGVKGAQEEIDAGGTPKPLIEVTEVRLLGH